ncbi:hypothetical protein MKW92_040508, partial [Papaver armeniacum]
MQEEIKNCIVRKTQGSTAIRIDSTNNLLRKPGAEPTTEHPSPYRLPHQMMITPPIPQKNHPSPARESQRVTEEGVHLRRKSLSLANTIYKLQQEAKSRDKGEQHEEQKQTSQ